MNLRVAFAGLLLAGVFTSCDDGGGGADTLDATRAGDVGCGDAGCDAGCVTGAPDCACAPSGRCNSGLVCSAESGLCTPPVGCVPGSLGCTCAAGAEPCEAPLRCGAMGVCERAPCLDGELGCPCGPDGACGGTRICAPDDSCQEADCPQGTRDCGCFADATCDPAPLGGSRVLTCDAERRCAPVLVVPDDPPCYSPCSESVAQDDGTVRRCSDEGLWPGCLGTRTCVTGQCLDEGETPTVCNTDGQCPEYQTCIQGGCYSTCEGDRECDADASCARKVCRLKCTTTGADCGAQQACRSTDGSDGVCMPLASPGIGQEPVVGAFTLTPELLEFTNVAPTAELRLTNSTDTPLEFVVRKAEHSTFDADGRTVHTDAPLPWVALGLVPPPPEGGAPGEVDVPVERVPELEVTVAAGATATVRIADTFNADLDRWEGRLEVGNESLGYKSLTLSYSSRADGQWTGSFYSLINFDDDSLDVWQRTHDANTARDTHNALISKWQAFRSGQVSVDEILAVLKATVDSTWSTPGTRTLCEAYNPARGVACYLYDDPSNDEPEPGVRIYTDTAETLRIPTGVVEMPFTLNMQSDAANPLEMLGRIESRLALQYPGNPPLHLTFARDPATCEPGRTDACIAPIASFGASLVLGGRFLPEGRDCAEAGGDTYQALASPWLLPEFTQGSRVDEEGRRLRDECREATFPLAPVGDSMRARNMSSASANPIPDGRARTRIISLVDGVLINGHTLMLLVKETFDGFVGRSMQIEKISTYGILVLQRSGAELPADAYTSGLLPQMPQMPPGLLALECDPALLDRLGYPNGLTPGNADRIARQLLTGIDPETAPTLLTGAADEPFEAHWLCEATGRFDGGPTAWTGQPLGAERCPPGSRIVYFVTPTGTEVREHACQGGARCPRNRDCDPALQGTCDAVLRAWAGDGTATLDPPRACVDAAGRPDPETTYCEFDRANLLADQRLYAPAPNSLAFSSLLASLDQAFRFKTRFRNPSGQSVGFVPAVCSAGADLNPYCYDPIEIEALRARMDCLIHISTRYRAQLVTSRAQVEDALRKQFSVYEYPPLAPGEVRDQIPFNGFERNYAELLNMLADDAFTRAVGSRFDIAGAASGTFDGDLFEPEGISLSGGAGYEMQLLYRATQAYQLVLDRFSRLSPTLWLVLASPDGNFITPESVTTYFKRLVDASTGKARTASMIASRYQALNRPGLARRVIERSYAEVFLEAATLSQMMKRAIDYLPAGQSAARSQLRLELETAQIGYRVALDSMRTGYLKITDDLQFFGLAPDYVPFPVLGPLDTNAVRVVLERGFESLRVAGEREDRAIDSGREFDTDAAQFQAELARVRNQYENELATLCGTFTGDVDGRVYPAIEKYIEQNADAKAIQDPCAAFQNGAIYQSVGELDDARFEVKAAILGVRNLFAEVAIEESRVAAECGARVQIGRLAFEAAGKVLTIDGEISQLNQTIAQSEREMALIDRSIGVARDGFSAVSATAGAAIGTKIATGAAGAALTALGGVVAGLQAEANDDTSEAETAIRATERQIAETRRGADFDRAMQGCCLDSTDAPGGVVTPGTCSHPGPTLANSRAQVDTLMVDLLNARLNLQRADLGVRVKLSTVRTQRQAVARLLAQQTEADRLLINVEAARNDPNVRIYRNAAVLDADKSFNDALQDAYRATRVFEYYTNQSYAHRDELFLARLAKRGEDNLENYLLDLQRSYRDFEEQNGLPELRLQIVSLKRDIWRMHESEPGGDPTSVDEAGSSFRERLADPALIDAQGHIAIPFSTTLDQVSPRTALHKLDHIEADIETADPGDEIGRLSLLMRGTGTVRGGDEGKAFYRFPPMRAVLNPFFNGVKKDTYDPAIYRDDRFKDRPFANTFWELGVDLRDEAVNRDLDLNDITDIVLFFYYTDFSAAE